MTTKGSRLSKKLDEIAKRASEEIEGRGSVHWNTPNIIRAAIDEAVAEESKALREIAEGIDSPQDRGYVLAALDAREAKR